MNKEESFKIKAKREQDAINYYITKKDNVTTTQNFNQFGHFDNYITSGATDFLAEIKVRTDYSFEQIERFGGSFLEFTKLEGIRQFKQLNKINDKILYFNFYKSSMVIYELDDDASNYQWQMKWLPKNDFDSTKVWKWVTCLNKKDIIEIIKYK